MAPRILFWLNYRRNHVNQGTLAVPSPFDGDSTVPYWYDKIASMAHSLAKHGCTDVLFPNPVMNVGGQADNQDGYGPYDDYDIGSKGNMTRFGSAEKLRRAVAIYHANGIAVHLDIVNHQRAGGHAGYYIYNAAGGKGLGRFAKRPPYFRGAPPRVPADPVPSPPDDFAFGDEFCPVNALPKAADGRSQLWHELIAAGDWLFRTTGADGARLDDMKGMNVGFMNSWMNSQAMQTKTFFGEYASGNSNDLNWWIDQVNGRASTLDFDFHYNMAQQVCMNPSFYMGALAGRGQAASNPMRAIPFVESMDSDTNGFATIVYNKILAYALLLGGEGLPLVYIRDYLDEPDCYGLRPEIDNLCWVHQVLANGPTVARHQSQHVYCFERTGAPGLLVALNNDFFNPSWKTITSQTAFGPHVQLHDFTGRNQQDCWTDGNGVATFGVPPGENGHGYGCWSRAEYQWHNVPVPAERTTTQDFVGAEDLDIGPLQAGDKTIGRIWCAAETLIDGQWYQMPQGSRCEIVDSTGRLLISRGQRTFSIRTFNAGWHKIHGVMPGAFTGAAPFRLRVTYSGTHNLDPKDY